MGRDDGRREKKTEEARLLLIEVARTGGSTQHGARGAVPVQSVYSLVLIVLYLWRVRKWRARRGAGAGWLAKELQDERTGHGKLHAWCGCWGGDERPPRLARGHERVRERANVQSAGAKHVTCQERQHIICFQGRKLQYSCSCVRSSPSRRLPLPLPAPRTCRDKCPSVAPSPAISAWCILRLTDDDMARAAALRPLSVGVGCPVTMCHHGGHRCRPGRLVF